MPYKSAAQRGYMHANLPKVAKKWDKEESGTKGKRQAAAKRKMKREY